MGPAPEFPAQQRVLPSTSRQADTQIQLVGYYKFDCTVDIPLRYSTNNSANGSFQVTLSQRVDALHDVVRHLYNYIANIHHHQQ